MKTELPIFDSSKLIAGITKLIPDCKTTVQQPGGGWDTVEISVRIPSCRDRILISGHNNSRAYSSDELEPRDKVPVEFIEFRDSCSDSSGGIQSRNLKLQLAATRIKHYLRQRGFFVGGHHDEYY